MNNSSNLSCMKRNRFHSFNFPHKRRMDKFTYHLMKFIKSYQASVSRETTSSRSSFETSSIYCKNRICSSSDWSRIILRPRQLLASPEKKEKKKYRIKIGRKKKKKKEGSENPLTALMRLSCVSFGTRTCYRLVSANGFSTHTSRRNSSLCTGSRLISWLHGGL